MTNDTFNFDLNDRQLEQLQGRYELIESLLDTYLSPAQKKDHAQRACQTLRISARTLRRYLKKVREKGVGMLLRKKRSDAGKLRLFSDQILQRALQLLQQNPYRSVRMVMKLIATDTDLAPKVQAISPSTLYYHLKKAGYDFKSRPEEPSSKIYHSFQADYPNQLWQGDARDGIPLPHPDDSHKKKMTYLFAWIDDFSRKILYARYYWDEKLPRMEDCFRQAVLRWGLPERLYCDNGRVYLSNKFLLVVTALEVKKIHPPAYAAWCKGKVEICMKLLKIFQREAALAEFKTIEELNSTLWDWIEVEYNSKVHSTTGETPNERFRTNLASHPPRRIRDLDRFNSFFLWPEERTVNKYGKIQMKKNHYPVTGLAVGTKVVVRYDPFDLTEIQVFHNNDFYCAVKASTLVTKEIVAIPEEKKSREFSQESADYFQLIREKAAEMKREQIEGLRFSDLKKED